MKTPKLESLNKNTIREKYISIHFPEFHTYIIEHYPTNLSWTEKLYWYIHKLTKRPVCAVCGNPVRFINIKEGYKTFCCRDCIYKSDDIKNRKKQTWIKKYGVNHPSKLESIKEKKKRTLLKHYGVTHQSKSEIVKERKKLTTMIHYGVENPFQSEEIKKKIKQTNLERYGVENPFQSEEIKYKIKQYLLQEYGIENPLQSNIIKEKIKQTNTERYGAEWPTQSQHVKDIIKTKSKEIQEKIYQTKKSNHSFNSSKIEQDFKKWLDEHGVNYKYQYRSEKYPFACDFYFPDKDLYLEIQGNWTHGFHPYNPDNENDKMIAEGWKNKHTDYYDIAHEVWTKSDPLKRETAKKNGLNWVEVFSCKLEDVVNYYLSN